MSKRGVGGGGNNGHNSDNGKSGGSYDGSEDANDGFVDTDEGFDFLAWLAAEDSGIGTNDLYDIDDEDNEE